MKLIKLDGTWVDPTEVTSIQDTGDITIPSGFSVHITIRLLLGTCSSLHELVVSYSNTIVGKGRCKGLDSSNPIYSLSSKNLPPKGKMNLSPILKSSFALISSALY